MYAGYWASSSIGWPAGASGCGLELVFDADRGMPSPAHRTPRVTRRHLVMHDGHHVNPRADRQYTIEPTRSSLPLSAREASGSARSAISTRGDRRGLQQRSPISVRRATRAMMWGRGRPSRRGDACVARRSSSGDTARRAPRCVGHPWTSAWRRYSRRPSWRDWQVNRRRWAHRRIALRRREYRIFEAGSTGRPGAPSGGKGCN